MGLRARWFAAGFLAAVLSAAVCICLLFMAGRGDFHQLVRAQRLPSGKTIRVTSFNLVWGQEHDDRRADYDCFALEYVLSGGTAASEAIDAETREVFELMRPISELWGFDKATIAAFPGSERKGHYWLYIFRRAADGAWKFERQDAKVFAND